MPDGGTPPSVRRGAVMTSGASAFECRRCGHCCSGQGGIVLTAKDVERLCAYLGQARDAFLESSTVCAGSKVHLGVRPDGYCLFFADGCGVHPARPDICRAWPYFRGNLVDSGSWAMSQDYCPGISPEVTHGEFVRQGLKSLACQGVGVTDDPDAPNALKLDGIGKP